MCFTCKELIVKFLSQRRNPFLGLQWFFIWSSAGGQLIIMSRLGPSGHQRRFVQNLINSSKKISPVSTTRWGAGHHTFPWTACWDHRQTQRISFREGDRTLLCDACSETKLSGFTTVSRKMAKIPSRYSFGWPIYRKEFVLQKRWPCLYLEGTRINLHINVPREARSLQQALQ